MLLPAGSALFANSKLSSAIAVHPLPVRNASNQRRTRKNLKSSKRLLATPRAALSATKQENTNIAIDFYALLKVSPAASRDGITKAFERCVDETPSVGYSAKALEARATILRSSYETLLNPSIRREYDQRLQLGEITEQVPTDFVPGILILLHDIAEYDTVISIGESWLAANKRHPQEKDVAMSVALARCDAARTTLDDRAEDKGIAESADGMLRAAREVLKRHRAAPKLQSQITEGLAELAPRLAFELVSRPLTESSARAKGLQMMPEVLAGPAAPPSIGQRPSSFRTKFLERLRVVLTPSEQSLLFEVAGGNFACSPSEMYSVALALIADGCAAYKPRQLQRAAQLLSKAETEAGSAEAAASSEVDAPMHSIRRAAEERNRRAVALAVCLLLLGDTDGSAEALGIFDTRPKCDRQVLAFMKANSPDRNDLLPGMCVLTQRWVQDVVFASFRGVEQLTFTLDTWFASPEVKQYIGSASATASSQSAVTGVLSSMGKIVTSPVAVVSGAVGRLIASFTNNTSAAASESEEGQGQSQDQTAEQVLGMNPASPASSLSEATEGDLVNVDVREGRRSRDLGGDGLSSSVRRSPPVPAGPPVTYSFTKEEQSAAAAMADAVQESKTPPPPAQPSPATATPLYTPQQAQLERQWEAKQAQRAAEKERLEQETAAAAAVKGAGARAASSVKSSSLRSENPFLKGITGKLQIEDDGEDETSADVPMSVSDIKPLGGEDDWMRRAYEPQPIPWPRLLTLTAITTGALLAALRPSLLNVHHPASPLRHIAAVALPSRSGGIGARTSNKAAAPLSSSEAAAVIKKWQSVKAAALGKKHAMEDLSTVLKGGVLKQWRDKAKDTKSKGWHYKHSVLSSKVLSVEPLYGDKASVRAGFKEEVTVHKGPSGTPQTFTTEYTVKYTLAKEGNDWFITSSQVQTS